MKDLLYLKDEQIKSLFNCYIMLIEKHFQILKKFYQKNFLDLLLKLKSY